MLFLSYYPSSLLLSYLQLKTHIWICDYLSEIIDKELTKKILVRYQSLPTNQYQRRGNPAYKVVKLTIKDEKVIRMEDFISGWISDGDILGRPVDLIFGSDGVLYLSDDKAGLIYIVTKSQL